MSQRLEFGMVLDDGTYICDGCLVREGHMHRCTGSDGFWQDMRSCDCPECKEPTAEEMAAFRATLEAEVAPSPPPPGASAPVAGSGWAEVVWPGGGTDPR